MNFLKKYAILFLPIISIVSYLVAVQYDWEKGYLPPELFWVEILFAISAISSIALYAMIFQNIWRTVYTINDKDWLAYGILFFLLGFTWTLILAFMINWFSLIHFTIPGIMGASSSHVRFFEFFGTVWIGGLVIWIAAALLGAIIWGMSDLLGRKNKEN